MKVLTWLWSQPGVRFSYEPWHVRVWAGMVRRHLTLPHTLAVVTDLQGDFGPDVEVIAPPRDLEQVTIPTWGPSRPQCLRRLVMFRRDAAEIFGTDRIVCMDLDLVVCGSLDAMLDVQDDFKITKGTARNRKYNGSMMALRLGSRPQAYEMFSRDKAVLAGQVHVGSDQAWLAHCLPGEKTWGVEDGVAFWNSLDSLADARLLFFAGPKKPWSLALAGQHKLISQNYRGSRTDRCLVLGYGETLWDDVERAIDRGYVSAVIASPEAAAHWPGPVLAIADNDAHAERLVAMHGFNNVTYCGLSGGQSDGASR